MEGRRSVGVRGVERRQFAATKSKTAVCVCEGEREQEGERKRADT